MSNCLCGHNAYSHYAHAGECDVCDCEQWDETNSFYLLLFFLMVPITFILFYTVAIYTSNISYPLITFCLCFFFILLFAKADDYEAKKRATISEEKKKDRLQKLLY